MLGWLKKIMAPLAVVWMFWCGPSVRADVQVEYYTRGIFTNFSNPGSVTFGGGAVLNPGGPYGGYSSVTVDSTADSQSSTLTYNYSDYKTAFAPDDGSFGSLIGSKSLGSFELTSTDTAATYDIFDGIQFTLEIYQVVPTSGSGSLVGTVTGTVHATPGGPTSQPELLVQFPSPYIIGVPTGNPSTQYKLELTDGNVHVTGVPGDATGLTGSVAVPLPGIVWAGMTLLSAVGTANVLRRRRRLLDVA